MARSEMGELDAGAEVIPGATTVLIDGIGRATAARLLADAARWTLHDVEALRSGEAVVVVPYMSREPTRIFAACVFATITRLTPVSATVTGHWEL